MKNGEKLREYTLGSDGFHYVCEHDITNESDPDRGKIYSHQIETAFQRTECTEELLAWIEKENEVYELHKSFSLEKKRNLLFLALDLDRGLYERLVAEKRIPDNSLSKTDEMSEEDVDFLMSYLRFTESLCSAICIYDDVYYEEEMLSESAENTVEDVQNVSEGRKSKYDPEWALHASEDLAERLFQLDLCEYELSDCDREEYESLMKLAEAIAYALSNPCDNRSSDRRKVLFTNGMNDRMLVITDAPKEKIEAFCRHVNQEMEDGENTYFDFLKKDYYVNVLFDSVISSESEDVDVIGHDESYDFSDYPVDGRVRFNSAQEMLGYLQGARDLYNPETGEYVWLYNEAGSIAVDNLSKEEILRILGEKEPGDSWSGHIPGGADIWDDVSYDGYKVPKGCTNLDYCKGHYAERWVDCNEYERLLSKGL